MSDPIPTCSEQKNNIKLMDIHNNVCVLVALVCEQLLQLTRALELAGLVVASNVLAVDKDIGDGALASQLQ